MTQNATIECEVYGGPNISYRWQFNGMDIAGQVYQILMLPNVTTSDGGVYTCTVSNTAGSGTASTNLFIEVHFITLPMNVSSSNGTSINLICDAEAFPEPMYQWRRSNGSSVRDGITDNARILQFDPIIFGDEGGYYCSAASPRVTILSQVATVASKINIVMIHIHVAVHFYGT